MADNSISNSAIPTSDSAPVTEETDVQDPVEEEEFPVLEEELIIEDFTIDGICGVY